MNITSCLAKPMPILFGVGVTSASNTSPSAPGSCSTSFINNLDITPTHARPGRPSQPPQPQLLRPAHVRQAFPNPLRPLPAPLPQTAPERSPQGVPTKIKRKPTHFPCFGGLSDGGAPSPPRPSVAQNHWPQCADRGGKWNGERKAEGGVVVRIESFGQATLDTRADAGVGAAGLHGEAPSPDCSHKPSPCQ